MNYRYVFDLDNTLVMTDELNNSSYNYALTQLGMHPIKTHTRITRDIVFAKYPNLADFQKNKIIAIKQSYFINHINLTSLNTSLITLLRSKEAAHCILWTSADKKRVSALLKYYDLEKRFLKIVYSKKQMICKDINKICEIFNCSSASLLLFDNDIKVVKMLKEAGLRVFRLESEV